MGLFDLFATKADTAVPVEASNVDAAAIAPYFSEVGNLFLFGGVITASRAEAMSVPTCARALSIILLFYFFIFIIFSYWICVC